MDWVTLSEEADEVHVLMNTNRFNRGPVNARRIAGLMAPGLLLERNWTALTRL